MFIITIECDSCSDSILAHPTYDSTWLEIETASDYADEIAAPTLMIGGWFDLETSGVVRAFNALVRNGGPAARASHRLLIGPWTHCGVDRPQQGQLEFPAAAGVARSSALAFFDKHLRGVDGGSYTERVRWFEMGRDRWRQSDTWPPPRRVSRSLYLADNAVLQPASPTIGDSSTLLICDPTSPCPTQGGAVLDLEATGGPVDQADTVEGRQDVLSFTTDVLDEDITVLGPSSVTLFVSSNRSDTDFMVRLTDVYPDGRSMLVADGARRARFRNGFAAEELMTPGEIYEIAIELADIAMTFRRGHRIRLDISSSNYPRFAVNRNDGGPLYNPAAPSLEALNRIHHDGSHPSRISFSIEVERWRPLPKPTIRKTRVKLR